MEVATRTKHSAKLAAKQALDKEWDDFLLARQEAVRKAERKLAKIRKSTAKTKARQAAKKWGNQAAKTKAAKLVLAAKQQDSKGKPPGEDLNIEERGCK